MKQNQCLHEIPVRFFKEISQALAQCDSPEMLSIMLAVTMLTLKKQLPPTEANHEVLAFIFLYLCIITGQNPTTIDVSETPDDEAFMKDLLFRVHNRDQDPPKDARPMLSSHLTEAKKLLTTKKADLSGTLPLSEANQWLTDDNVEDDSSDWD